jgi:hypothetical protein
VAFGFLQFTKVQGTVPDQEMELRECFRLEITADASSSTPIASRS